jgi:hypothetical protein
MASPVKTMTFARTQADMDRIVRAVTLLHGRLVRPKRRRS